MAASNHKVTLDVAIKTQEEKLSKLDSELENIKRKSSELSNKKIQMKIEADTNKLKDVDTQTKKIENQLQAISNAKFHPGAFKIDDSNVDELKTKLKSLENQRINIQADIDKSKLQIDKNTLDMKVAVEKSALDNAKAEADSMDGETINMSLQLAYQNFSQGIQTCKQGVEDLISSMKEVEQAGIQTEQNMAFLTKNLGADKAKQTFQEISDVVASMPGDDNTMRSVLSTAQAMGNNLNAEEMKKATATMADYMAGSAMMGKMEKETQQDILKYLLDGNTAELERGSIVSSRVDKLKEANTFMERQKAMQEVLNELGYGGISQMDTLYNKQQEWNGMIYNSQAAMAGLWRNAEMGLIDFALGLNESTNGLAGMAIVLAQMAGGPIVEILTGLGQISMGLKSLKDAAGFLNIGDKLSSLKTALIDVAVKAKEAAISLASTLKSAIVSAAQSAKTLVVELAKVSKELLINAANALKSAAAWVVDKAARLASALASGIMTAAQWALNIAMSANPITLVVIAIIALIAALTYLYMTCEPVRNAIDGFGQALWGIGEAIWGGISGAIQWLIDGFTWLWNVITTAFTSTSTEGINWLNTMMMVMMGPIGWILLLIAHWNQIGPAVSGALSSMYQNAVNWLNQTGASVHSFASNIVSTLGSAARNAANSFISGISGLASAFINELSNMLSYAVSWASNLASQMASAASNAVSSFLGGLHIASPGIMQIKFIGEMEGILNAAKDTEQPLSSAMSNIAGGAVNNFDISTNGDFDAGAVTGGAVTGGAGGTIINNEFNFIFTDFIDDKEKLTNLIIRTITDEIEWDNDRAGRTV